MSREVDLRAWSTTISLHGSYAERFGELSIDDVLASANRRCHDRHTFAGSSWLFCSEADFLAETNIDQPFVTVSLDLDQAVLAKETDLRTLSML